VVVPKTEEIVSTFRANVSVVEQLLEFGNVVIDAAIGALTELEAQLESRNLHSAVTLVQNRAAMLAQIKRGDSLRPQYEAMFNQCVVLLVSHFGSAVHSLFKHGVEEALRLGTKVPAASHELRVSWDSVVRSDDKLEGLFADLLIAQNDISFQDMQSIARAFKNHLQVDVHRTNDVNNIILGQAARHVIVHSAGGVDRKMTKQVADAHPRGLMVDVAVGAVIQFNPDEVRTLATSMNNYLVALVDSIAESRKGDAHAH